MRQDRTVLIGLKGALKATNVAEPRTALRDRSIRRTTGAKFKNFPEETTFVCRCGYANVELSNENHHIVNPVCIKRMLLL